MYTTFPGAVKMIYYLSLGEVGHTQGAFEEGKKTSVIILWIFFFLATFILLIVMMNMLIAIMGNTFTKNYEI